MAIRVLAAVIERQGSFLICQRALTKRHGGLWEFPGGKIEAAETDSDAAKRELSEELALQVTSVGQTIFSVADPGSDFAIEFVPVVVEGDPCCLEHAAIAWVGLPDLLDYDLAPSDRQFAIHLQKAALNPVNTDA